MSDAEVVHSRAHGQVRLAFWVMWAERTTVWVPITGSETVRR